MGTDVNEVVERLPSPRDVKVHRVMCTELMKLIDKIAKIFPEIEAARPRCLSGIQTLCLLNKAIEKANSLLQYCSESSKLYMALTGDVIQSRFEKTGKLLEQSLSQIQNIVPVTLAVKISRIISDLRGAKFSLDPPEEEAGKVVKTLLQHAGSTKESESAIKAIEIAALRLQITSKKALLIEKRSIRKLFDKLGDDEFAKKQILLFLLSMLKKYEKTIVGRQSESVHVQHEASILLENPCDPAVETESRVHHGPNEAQPDVLSRPIPPEEFKCPLSTRLMYDPVVIASGQTFERMWIQKWFDEGHLTCPNTKRKLAHLSLTPNTVMKDLVSNWCAAYGVTIRDPHMQSAEVNSWETSSTSIASLSSSMNDLHLQIDFSHVSIGSLDTSHGSDDDFDRFQSSANKHDRDLEILRELDSLPWESQCKVVEDVSIHLKHDDQDWDVISPKNFVDPLVKFLKDALEMNDVKAQRTGCVVLLAFVSKCSGIQNMHEDAYDLLVSFIDSEVTEEALAIMEVLSRYRYCRSKIAASNALCYITKMLDTERRFFCETAIKILYNFSLYNDLNILIVSSELIRKLVPFLEDDTLAIYSISILNKLCDNENAKVSVVETNGCISSVAKLLDSDSREEQEHATGVFLSLCSQHDKYCKLVMDEGVIPALVDISVNGNENGKIKAMELLRLLRDIKYDDVQECRGPNVDFYRDFTYPVKEKKTSSTVSGFFGKISKFSIKGFSAPRIQK